MSVHSASGQDACPVGLTCFEVTIGKSQFKHTFIVCKILQKECVIDLDMQHVHHLGCDWADIGWLFLCQSTDILIPSIDAVTIIRNLKTMSNAKISAHSIVTIPIKLTGKCIIATPYKLEVEIGEIVTIQNSQLIMIPKAHLKDDIEPAWVPLIYHMIQYKYLNTL